MTKALIAMSGGVDSSVAACLMTSQGYECIGCTMKLYENADVCLPKHHTCCSLDDVEDARSVAYKLGMPYYVFNFSEDFHQTVISKFIKCYECGRTPNPCIDCNRYMKFDKLYERAKVLGCDYIVTGHYVRIEETDGQYFLKKAIDDTKDQSYVLYSMTQEQLAHTKFPLGDLKKVDARKIADEHGFINADKPDSQDICFVPDGDYASFLTRQTGKEYKTGNFIDINGKVLGTHKGIVNYTIGQRKGIGISFNEPMYVGKIDVQNNTVTLCKDNELFQKFVEVEEFNWISGKAPTEEFHCKAKIRYRQKEQSATVIPIGDDKIRIVFDEPQRAITAGQAAVLYDEDVVLGGGVIVDSYNNIN